MPPRLKKAISCYLEALRVYTPDTFPLQYAIAQHNLGSVYLEGPTGTYRDDLEKAITCYLEALPLYKTHASPSYYADLLVQLGQAYQKRIAGERSDNLERAIASYQEALRVDTIDKFPAAYARVQSALGSVYRSRIEGESRDNLERALQCYREALRVYTPQGSLEYSQVQLNLVQIEAERGNWAGVHEALSGVLTAEETIMVDHWRLVAHRTAAARDGFALTRLSRIPEAAAAIERGRSRSLLLAVADEASHPNLIKDEKRRAQFIAAKKELISTHQDVNTQLAMDLDPDSFPTDPTLQARAINEKRRRLQLAREAAYSEARANFNAIVTEIRQARDPADFLGAVQEPADFLESKIDPANILRAAQRGGIGHALVYLAASPWGGTAVAAFGTSPSDFMSLDLPLLTESLVDDLVQQELKRNPRNVIGGFAHAQEGNGFKIVLREWEGATFRARAAALSAACAAANTSGTLDAASRELLRNPVLAQLADRPLEVLGKSNLTLLETTFGHIFLKLELVRCLKSLTEVALHPLATWLQKLGVTGLTLIPCGALAAFPLLSAEVVPGKTLGDLLPASVAPSARAFLRTGSPDTHRAGLYAVGNPHPTHQELHWSEAEALTLSKLARQSGLPAEAQVQGKAKRDWLIEAFRKGLVVDASCHGIFNAQDPDRSALLLADGERLTLASMHGPTADLRGLRLLILSACQTAILDLREARDEVRSLAASMLQAGAAAVLAALWPVDDRATYLLMVRFAQEWLPRIESEPPAAALARAQKWLRTVTNRELLAWCASSLPKTTPEERRKAGSGIPERDPWIEERDLPGMPKFVAVRGRGNRYDDIDAESLVRATARRKNDPDACPYADPIFWAAFQITGW